MHTADRLSSAQTGVYAGALVDDEIAQALLEANREVHALARLVLDDDLRRAVADAAAVVNLPSLLHRATVGEGEAAMDAGIRAVEQAQGRIASRIREI